MSNRDINHRIFCQEELNRLLDNFKDYSFGECMYAIMSCGKIKDRNDLLSIQDKEMHSIIFKTVKKEEDEQ